MSKPYDPGAATDSVPTLADAATSATPVSGLAYLAGTTPTLVGVANGLPVQPATGATWPVSGPLTDTQLRASAVPVSLASVPTHAVTQGTSPWVVSLTSTTITGSVATTVADGGDVALGAKADAAATDSTSSWSVVALLKGLWAKLAKLTGLTADPTTGQVSPPDLDTAPAIVMVGWNFGDQRWQTVRLDPDGIVQVGGSIGVYSNGALIARLADLNGDYFASATTTPGASDRGLVVRPIPSGTQTVSGTVTLGAGSAAIGSVSITGTPTVSGPLTDSQLRASAPAVTTVTGATVTGTIVAGASGAGLIVDAGTPPAGTTGYAVEISGGDNNQNMFAEVSYAGDFWTPCPISYLQTFLGTSPPAGTQVQTGLIGVIGGAANRTQARAYTDGLRLRIRSNGAPSSTAFTVRLTPLCLPALGGQQATFQLPLLTKNVFPAWSSVAGPSIVSATSAASQNATLISTSAAYGILSLFAANKGGSVRYLKLYNTTSAPVSSDTPFAIYPLLPGWAGQLIATDVGFRISATPGFSYAITAGAAGDWTAVGAGDVTFVMWYTPDTYTPATS